MGSCQYCHAITSYGTQNEFAATLNPYGKDYLKAGRNGSALTAIETLDSDGDRYSNIIEIKATRYPGDPNDDPTKVTAPYRIFDKAKLESMPQHIQFMLMNTTKSGDYYATYSGVIMQDLLKDAGITAKPNIIMTRSLITTTEDGVITVLRETLGAAITTRLQSMAASGSFLHCKRTERIWCLDILISATNWPTVLRVRSAL
jgi:hypothetical protein